MHLLLRPILFLLLLSPLSAAAHVVISIDEKGFSPATTTIPQGEEVIFRNSGTQPHWPASNIHPTHQIYPVFDPARGLAPGEEWTFRFDKTGKWKMHDHLFPQFTGEIQVTGEGDISSTQTPARSFRERARSFFGTIRTWIVKIYYRILPSMERRAVDSIDMFDIAKDERLITYWVQILGADEAMKKLLKDSGNGGERDCHQEAHLLGRVSYELFGAEVFGEGNASCHSGFYHGAMEALLRERGTDNLAATITSLCGAFKTRFGNFECLHGVGHGVLVYEDYNLPSALDDCASLPDQFSKSSCYGGVFMENIVTAQGIGANPEHSTEWVRNDDPHFPCNALGSDYEKRYQCYQMQTSWMLTLNKQDFKKVARECVSAPKDMTGVCFQSFGRDAAGNTLRDPRKITDICAGVPSDHYDKCITGALNVIVDFWGDGLTREGDALCSLVPDPHRNACYSVLAGRLRDVFGSSQERKKACGYFAPSYQSLCASL